MSTQAFGTRRVTESLKAIAKYLDDGALIAGGVSPAGVIPINPQPAPRPPSPRLTSVSPNVVRLDEGEAEDFTLTVTGVDLDHADVFKLVLGGSVIEASDVTVNSSTSLSVDFEDVLDPASGEYDAWVVTDTGQAFVLDDACRIKVRRNRYNADASDDAEDRDDTARSAPTDGLSGMAAVPITHAGSTIDVWVPARGASSEAKWYVNGSDGTVRRNWKIKVVARALPKDAKRLIQQQRQRGAVGLTITVPKGEVPGVYRVYAQSRSDSTGRLTLFVEVQ